MDFDPQTLLYIVVAILFLVFSGLRRRRKPSEQAPDVNTQENIPREIRADANVPSDSDIVLPPFMQNFEGADPNVGTLQDTIESEAAELPMEPEQAELVTEPEPEPQTQPIEPPPVPVDAPTKLPTKPLPATSLIELSPETFRQGIILSEILGRPKGLRNRK